MNSIESVMGTLLIKEYDERLICSVNRLLLIEQTSGSHETMPPFYS